MHRASFTISSPCRQSQQLNATHFSFKGILSVLGKNKVHSTYKSGPHRRINSYIKKRHHVLNIPLSGTLPAAAKQAYCSCESPLTVSPLCCFQNTGNGREQKKKKEYKGLFINLGPQKWEVKIVQGYANYFATFKTNLLNQLVMYCVFRAFVSPSGRIVRCSFSTLISSVSLKTGPHSFYFRYCHVHLFWDDLSVSSHPRHMGIINCLKVETLHEFLIF